MKIKILLPVRIVFLFLLLLGSSSSAFSANQSVQVPESENAQEELVDTSLGEQIDEVFDSILPFHINPVTIVAGFAIAEDFNARILNHTLNSLSYIKRSRYIFPNLGIKEVIFPFHVFLRS